MKIGSFIYSIVFAIAAISLLSCSSDLLQVESKTSVTTDYLFSSKEGLQKAIVGLYALDRDSYDTCSDASALFEVVMMDYCTDLFLQRAGSANALARLDNQTPSTAQFLTYWKGKYQVIGKANEVIAAAKEMGLEDGDIAHAYGEACLMRAKAYFLLYQRYERLYLNTEPTTIENAFGRTFTAAAKEDIFAQIKADLEEASKYLDWAKYNGEDGRLTKAVAKHIRAQIAMWEDDWSTAVKECESIIEESGHTMAARTIEVFEGANLNNPEVLWALQFSNQPGGGGSVSGGVVAGHYVSLNVTPNYKTLTGVVNSVDNGGYGWGRVYPNSYLLGLYDKEKDHRYQELFQHKWYYNDPENLPAGKRIGDEVTDFTKSQYISACHPSCLKYYDRWTNTDDPNRKSSFKDLVIYRLAETYLMCAEAYFHLEGGSSTKALEYYNKTWERAGNEHFAGPLTLDIILEECARELHFEGVRYGQLKRLGLLEERVKLHAGDSKSDDPNLASDYIQPRKNFRSERDWRWPIPQAELDLMPGFGQNEGWL